MNEWVIEVWQNYGGSSAILYHDGNTYVHQGDCYGAFPRGIDNAKVYTSEKKAINAMEKLKVKVWNWDKMTVVQKEENA